MKNKQKGEIIRKCLQSLWTDERPAWWGADRDAVKKVREMTGIKPSISTIQKWRLETGRRLVN